MTKRLQVLMDDSELAELQRIARAQRMTMAAWVRQLLRAARDTEAVPDPRAKLALVRAAAAHAFPAPDIDQMLREIERGYLEDRPSDHRP